MQATRADAASGLLDIRRLSDMLSRIKGHIVHQDLPQISPLAVPIMLEVGKESVSGEANDALLAEAADDLIAEALSETEGEPQIESAMKDKPCLEPKADRPR
jgi:ATP-dependent Lhr-like helicase